MFWSTCITCFYCCGFVALIFLNSSDQSSSMLYKSASARLLLNSCSIHFYLTWINEKIFYTVLLGSLPLLDVQWLWFWKNSFPSNTCFISFHHYQPTPFCVSNIVCHPLLMPQLQLRLYYFLSSVANTHGPWVMSYAFFGFGITIIFGTIALECGTSFI